MGKQKVASDVLLESHGHCFFCLNPTSAETSTLNGERHVTPAAVYSLQYVTHFLGMNLGRVVSSKVHVQPNSRTRSKEPTPRLNVELCDDCVSLNKQFFELFQSLENINMKVGSCLFQIREKLLVTREKNDSKKTEEYPGMSSSGGSLTMVNLLRGEALLKCSQKLHTFQPRVMLQKMTEEGLEAKPSSLDNVNNKNANYNQVVADENEPTSTDDDMEQPILTTGKTGHNPVIMSSVKNVSKKRRGRKQIRPWCIDPHTHQYRCLFNLCSQEFPKYIQLYSHHNDDHHLPRGTYTKKWANLQRNVGKQKSENKIIPRSMNQIKLERAAKPGIRFRCQRCHRSFSRKDALMRHQRLSKSCGTRPVLKPSFNHICKFPGCGKGFSTENARRVHFKGVHLELRQHVCNICRRSFGHKFNMERHQRLVHKAQIRRQTSFYKSGTRNHTGTYIFNAN